MDRQAVPVSEIARRLAEIADQQRALEIERKVLEDLRAKAVHLDRGRTTTGQPAGKISPSGPGSAGAQSVLELVPAGKAGPSQAIVELLRAEPQLKPAEVVRRLIGSIATSSSKPKKVLFQTIANLQKKGRLIADADGRLRLVG